MRIQHIVLLLLIIGIKPGLQAQEFVDHLPVNTKKSFEALHSHQAAARSTELPLTLPFWDDFSHPGPYPDQSLWADNYVFINAGFAVHPKTAGVATFDMLDEHGEIYDHIETGNILYTADFLTSHPIDISEFTPEDSLVLSFYYQPQGTGGNPGRDESLVLQFLGPEEDDDKSSTRTTGRDIQREEDDLENWIEMWSANGEKLSDFSQDTFPYFHRVSIAITDEDYFREDFRFRFLNNVAVPIGQDNNTGTRSIWNIDYVYLDADRSVLDSAYQDIAFAAPAQSIMRELSSAPWSHYLANPEAMLRERFNVTITNLSSGLLNYNYRYLIKNQEGEIIRNYSGGSNVMAPFFEEGYLSYAPHSNPIVVPNPLIPLSPDDQRHYTIVHALQQGADGDPYPRNDTITYHQSFTNHFSYDDGSAEMIHLLKGFDPSRVMQFTAMHTDMLEAVQIAFLETIDNQNEDRSFELCIYSSLDPEKEIYRSEEFLITSDGELMGNGPFYEFALQEAVEVEDTFYVGITQIGNVPLGSSLVVGFDLSNNVQHRLFIKDGVNANGDWYESGVNGALMIRPVMQRETITGIADNDTDASVAVNVYPNPLSSGYLHIDTDEALLYDSRARISVFDVRGRLVYSGGGTSSLDLSALQDGMYLLRIINPAKGVHASSRFIISR